MRLIRTFDSVHGRVSAYVQWTERHTPAGAETDERHAAWYPATSLKYYLCAPAVPEPAAAAVAPAVVAAPAAVAAPEAALKAARNFIIIYIKNRFGMGPAPDSHALSASKEARWSVASRQWW